MTNVPQYYKAYENVNHPAIKKGTPLFTTNLVKPKLYDFIAYRVMLEGKPVIWFHRVCAMEKDTVLIKDGIMYVNGINIDTLLPLSHDYWVGVKDIPGVEAAVGRKMDDILSYKEDSSLIYLADADVKRLKLKVRRFIYPDYMDISPMEKNFDPSWTPDNFGPVVVPEGQYWAIGDNRHRTMDSRYMGFVKAGDVKGVILGY